MTHHEEKELFHLLRRLMAAIDNANKNLADLKADVESLIAKPAGVPEAQVQAVADAIAALDAEVKTALTPAV